MMTDTLTFEIDPLPPSVSFTYSHPDQSLFRRSLIRAVEMISGQPRLQRLYMDWADYGKQPGESVFDAALRLLEVRPACLGEENLKALPKTGGLLLVANHPFGIVDGLSLGHIGMRLRGNVSILTNSLLCRVPEVDPHLLPVDFSGTPEARRLTGETRRRAAQLLSEGKTVAIFPGGSVATANRPFRGPAVDTPWHPFVGRLATIPGVTTLPLHFGGQNSRLFQIASHASYPLRIALIFSETRRRMGLPVKITFGTPILAEEMRKLDRAAVAGELRRRTMLLGPKTARNPDEVFNWPAHITW